MSALLAILTYFAYVFIVTMYAVKAVKIARMPVHLRWELYPVIHETKRQYGASYYEDLERWAKHRHQTVLRGVLFLLKENLCFGEYFHRNRGYWLVLLPWHLGFILIITFHVLCFGGALAQASGVSVSAESIGVGGMLYFLILLTGVASFVSGSLGSVGLFIKRVCDKDLRAFATPQNYFNYLFTLMVFASGLYAWYFVDPTLFEYRKFWTGLVTLSPARVESPAAIHIILFALFLIYLPFTRSLHYITKFFSYFWVRWDDQPNWRGSKSERRLEEWLNQPVSWSAPHIPPGRTWAEIASDSKDY